MRLTQRTLSLGIAAGALMSLTVFSPALAQQKVLTIGSAFVPVSLDPALSGNGRAGMAVIPAYEPLVRVAHDGKIEPALATKWEVANDQTAVTFTLRTDAKFSDGDPVNAEAVKKSLEYYRSVRGPFQTTLQTVTAIDELAPDKIRISMSVPQPAIVTMFESYWNAGLIISPQGVAAPDTLPKETRGAGPYKLDPAATILGKSYTYVPNEHYY